MYLPPKSHQSKCKDHQSSSFKVFKVLKCLWLSPPGRGFFLAAMLAVSSSRVHHEPFSSSLSRKSLCARPDGRTVELISIGDGEAKRSILRQYLFIPIQDRFRQDRQSLRGVGGNNLNSLKLKSWQMNWKNRESTRMNFSVWRNSWRCLSSGALGIDSEMLDWRL